MQFVDVMSFKHKSLDCMIGYIIQPLWVRWLLVGASSAVHASFGTESRSYTSLAFLMPEQEHHKFKHFQNVKAISIDIQPFQAISIHQLQPFTDIF